MEGAGLFQQHRVMLFGRIISLDVLYFHLNKTKQNKQDQDISSTKIPKSKFKQELIKKK